MTMSIDRASSAGRGDDTLATGTADNGSSAERAAQMQVSTSDTRSQPRAETRTREQYADAMRAGGSPMSRDNSPADGQPGDRMISADQAAMPAQDQRGADHQPETITFDSKEIEITHNAADGIWVEGLPGEVPRRIGDLLASPEEGRRSRIENLREEFNKDAEDILDMGGKWTDLLRDALGTPPPTNSMTHSRSPEIGITTPEHGINAGQGVEAFLTLAIVGAAAVHKLHERWRRAWDH